MANYRQLTVYGELESFCLSLNRAIINGMERDVRNDIGIDMRKLMRDMKYCIYLINSDFDSRADLFKRFNNMYQHMKILMDECEQLQYLKETGVYSLEAPKKKFQEIGKQIAKWKAAWLEGDAARPQTVPASVYYQNPNKGKNPNYASPIPDSQYAPKKVFKGYTGTKRGGYSSASVLN